jgi:DNA-binding MarR family transcriptional regulator
MKVDLERNPGAAVPDIDAFVHEPARLRLLAFLAMFERADFVFLIRHSGVSRGNLSVQMSKLAEAGYVEIDKRFVNNRPRTVYSLTNEGRAALRVYRRDMTTILEALPR